MIGVQWALDASAGQWIVERTSGQFGGTVPDLLPAGFEAYVRVFHPFCRCRDGRSCEDASWAETAADFGTIMHPLAQSAGLLGAADPWSVGPVTSPSGWTYQAPSVGWMPKLQQVMPILAAHTTTASSAVAAIWEGWGSPVSSPGRGAWMIVAGGIQVGLLSRPLTWFRRVGWRCRDSAPRPGTGVLPADVVNGPKLELPGRSYILAHLSLDELAGDDWEQSVLWANPPLTRTPSLLWPDDHAWMLATEIDFDTALIGGSSELAESLLKSPELEVLEVPPTADLRWRP